MPAGEAKPCRNMPQHMPVGEAEPYRNMPAAYVRGRTCAMPEYAGSICPAGEPVTYRNMPEEHARPMKG